MALQALGRHEEAVATYDTLIERFGDTADPDIGELLVEAQVDREALAAGDDPGHPGRALP